MFWLISGAMQGRFLSLIPSNDSSNYVPVDSATGSSDIGKLIMMSSNTAICAASTDFSVLSTNVLANNLKLAGILAEIECELDKSSNSTFGSTACKYKVQPIVRGDIIGADYSTSSTNSSGTSGDLHTTNIGMYYRPCFSSNSTNVTLRAEQREYINVTTGVNVPDAVTGAIFKLLDYSTINKTAVFMVDYNEVVTS